MARKTTGKRPTSRALPSDQNQSFYRVACQYDIKPGHPTTPWRLLSVRPLSLAFSLLRVGGLWPLVGLGLFVVRLRSRPIVRPAHGRPVGERSLIDGKIFRRCIPVVPCPCCGPRIHQPRSEARPANDQLGEVNARMPLARPNSEEPCLSPRLLTPGRFPGQE